MISGLHLVSLTWEYIKVRSMVLGHLAQVGHKDWSSYFKEKEIRILGVLSAFLAEKELRHG